MVNLQLSAGHRPAAATSVDSSARPTAVVDETDGSPRRE
jgi:hypothetical protein